VPSAIIIGSGPAAAATAMALQQRHDWKITVLDIGQDLEPANRAAVDRLGAQPAERWTAGDLTLVTVQPEPSGAPGLPDKRSYGSDYPFRDAGQLSPMAVEEGVADALVSPAYGGFSAVWGAQVLPFPRETFDAWPLSHADMVPYYRAVLSRIPFAAAEDDLAEMLPLHASPQPPLPPSPRAADVLRRYRLHRDALHRRGLILGMGRVAVQSSDCTLRGLCMTGCPYSLIYSAAHTFDELRAKDRIQYHSGLLAVELSETPSRATVVAREIATGQRQSFDADRVFVACGAVGTTRLVLDSLRCYGRDVILQQSAQFIVPFVSRRSSGDPRRQPSHALGQLSAVLKLPDAGVDPVHLQLYTYNPAFLDAIPRVLQRDLAGPLRSAALARLSVGLGYLPSSVSPRLRIRLGEPTSPSRRAPLVVSRDPSSSDVGPLLRSLGRRLIEVAPRLDLWPVLPRVQLSAPGKSYHWGGTLPHSATTSAPVRTDRLGRLPAWRRIHVVDGAVMPSIASTSFTLTLMANAYRIAEESLAMPQTG
jgi:choline dehydrogenase-like flavoprotein